MVPSKHFELEDPGLRAEVRTGAHGWEVVLEGRRLARFVMVDFEGFDAILEDNFVDLVPGAPRVLGIREFRGEAPADAAGLNRALRVRSLWDSFSSPASP